MGLGKRDLGSYEEGRKKMIFCEISVLKIIICSVYVFSLARRILNVRTFRN
jgi:hypothetical protein